MRMIRSIVLSAATATLATLTVLGAGCGGSTAKGTSSDGGGGGSDATSDAPKHADSGGGDSGDDGGSTACTLPSSAVAPNGTQLVKSTTVTLNGVTDDGYAFYSDTMAGTSSVVPLAGGAPTAVGMNDLSGQFTGGPIAFSFNGAGMTGVGSLTIWTSAHGPQTISAAAVAPQFPGQGPLDVSSDGTHVVFMDNAAGNTTDITVINTDGTGKVVLAPGLDLTSMTCFPGAIFAGAYIVIETCAAGSDGGDSSTLTSYTGTGWTTKATLATTANGSLLPVVDPTGATILYNSASGLQVATLATGASVPIDAAGTTGLYTSDGMHVVYATTGGAINLAAVTGGTPTPLVAAGGYAGVLGLSPDNNWLLTYKSATQDNAGDNLSDLYLASATTAGAATTLSSTVTASLFGDPFTTDSSHAIYSAAIQNGSGTLTAMKTAAGSTPTTLAMLDWTNSSAAGAQVVFNTNDTQPAGCGGPGGTADLESVDTSTTTPAKVLVNQADTAFFLDKAKDKVVYSWSYLQNSSAGIWVLPLQ
jgi:hypothetical protein